MILRVALASLLSTAQLCAQTQPAVAPAVGSLPDAPPPVSQLPVSELIDHLVANANLYRATLPSLSADETIISDVSYFGIFRKHANATATFRAVRTSEGSALEESRQITILNGKPVAPGETVDLPTVLLGGFGRFQDMFFTRQHRPCFNFVLAPTTPGEPLQIAIALKPTASTIPSCEPGLQGLTGIARIDPVTGQITHLERTIPVDVANKSNHAIFAAVDSAPTKVGDETFWLPTAITGNVQQDRMKGKFTARYSNYHRYTATTTILPATPVYPTSTESNP
jgi:hypothetical protein